MLQNRQPRPCALVFLSLMLVVPSAFGQDNPCARLEAVKKEVYGFRPTRLSEQQQKDKGRQIDRFWTLAESQGDRGVTCLRKMLKAETTDPFFLFDGSTLLFHLDRSPQSMTVVTDAVTRSDLGEINPAGYIELLLELAQHGVDSGALAEKYMKFPKVDGFVPEHSLSLDRATGAIFIYGSMPPGRADKYLVPLLGSEEGYVHSTAALMLALNMTGESYRALAGLPGIDDLPDQVRKQVIAALAYHSPAGKVVPTYSREQILARLRGLPRTPEQMEAEFKKEKPVVGIADDEPFVRSAIATLGSADLDAVREARRNSLMSLSDESLYEYAAYTRIILGIINRLDLYREFRVH